MDEEKLTKVLKCLYDIKNAILDVESYFEDYPNRYDVFAKDGLRIAAVERKTEIMGEAVYRIFDIDKNFEMPNAKEVIKTRNRIIHGYDSVTPEFLWGLLHKHIPKLKIDVESHIAIVEDALEEIRDGLGFDGPGGGRGM